MQLFSIRTPPSALRASCVAALHFIPNNAPPPPPPQFQKPNAPCLVDTDYEVCIVLNISFILYSGLHVGYETTKWLTCTNLFCQKFGKVGTVYYVFNIKYSACQWSLLICMIVIHLYDNTHNSSVMHRSDVILEITIVIYGQEKVKEIIFV